MIKATIRITAIYNEGTKDDVEGLEDALGQVPAEIAGTGQLNGAFGLTPTTWDSSVEVKYQQGVQLNMFNDTDRAKVGADLQQAGIFDEEG